jgi:hypothetical protein
MMRIHCNARLICNRKVKHNILNLGLPQKRNALDVFARKPSALRCTVNAFLQGSFALQNASAMDAQIMKTVSHKSRRRSNR